MGGVAVAAEVGSRSVPTRSRRPPELSAEPLINQAVAAVLDCCTCTSSSTCAQQKTEASSFAPRHPLTHCA